MGNGQRHREELNFAACPLGELNFAATSAPALAPAWISLLVGGVRVFCFGG